MEFTAESSKETGINFVTFNQNATYVKQTINVSKSLILTISLGIK